GPRSGRSRPARIVLDAVVIGSGAAGLTAGALLAEAGRRVRVVEAGEHAGGHLRSLLCAGHRLDVSVHFLMASHEGGLVRQILERLGVDAPLRPSDRFVTARYPDLTVTLP